MKNLTCDRHGSVDRKTRSTGSYQ